MLLLCLLSFHIKKWLSNTFSHAIFRLASWVLVAICYLHSSYREDTFTLHRHSTIHSSQEQTTANRFVEKYMPCPLITVLTLYLHFQISLCTTLYQLLLQRNPANKFPFSKKWKLFTYNKCSWSVRDIQASSCLHGLFMSTLMHLT